MNDFHFFDTDVSGILSPERLNSPFHYTPHRLAVEAAGQVRRYISTVPELASVLACGKMIGVLVVEDCEGNRGFVAAYSGSLELPRHMLGYFVPPVYDLLDEAGYFKREEREISSINHRIAAIECGAALVKARDAAAAVAAEGDVAISDYKQMMVASKLRRDAGRVSGDIDEESAIRESQYQKAELRRLRKTWAERVEAARVPLTAIEGEIEALKHERRNRSEALQRWAFEQFSMLNARGERRNLLEIFADTPQHVPPAGAGECAAPRLLQYAYEHRLKPVVVAEFWYGKPQGGNVRHDGEFYPACRGKCLPILTHMLQGLDVEIDPPYAGRHFDAADLKVICADRWMIIVDKPAGVASVPGRNCGTSVLDMLQSRYPALDGPVVVHRLDMDTSGIMVFARDKETHKRLQAMFACREVTKRYVALLDGCPVADSGMIDLPLSADYEHRPMQMVDMQHGASAVTRYEVIEHRSDGTTLVYFYPQTGRTHQLRIHAAHHLGLGTPIVGDRLYGRKADRLYLHAEMLAMTHPFTGEKLRVHAALPSCFTQRVTDDVE